MTSFVNDNGDEIQYSGGDLLLTKQVASFRNFKIKGDVSVSFSIPNSSTNRSTLGYFGFQQVNSPVFSQTPFNMVKDGNTITRGYLIIESDNGDELSIFFVSGNANWFRAFDFSCKEIRNYRYRTYWTYFYVDLLKSADRGIIFPQIDWMYQRNKFDKYTFVANVIDESTSAENPYPYTNIFPCLYVHTLVEELGKVANIKIDGTLINDKFYRSLIITPEGPEIYNDYGRASNFSAALDIDPSGRTPIIDIHNIAPTMKALEIIRWLSFTFGCVPVFDEYTQTLTLNVIEKIKKEDSYDWSQYVQGYNIRYNQYQNNYIRMAEAPESEIQIYNNSNPDALFGELNIESQKDDGSSQDLYECPFAPVADNVGTTPLAWATPFIEFYQLEDSKQIPFTAVTSNGGKAEFACAFPEDISQLFNDNVLVMRIQDEDNIYTGFHNITHASATYVRSSCDFISDTTGSVYIQNVTPNEAGPRILVCIPNYPVANFMGVDSFNVLRVGDITHVAYAYYHKPRYSQYSNLNGYRPGLSYGSLAVVEDVPTTTPDVPPIIVEVTLVLTAELSCLFSASYYYKINSGSWTFLTDNDTLGFLCPVFPSNVTLSSNKITCLEGDTVYIGVLNDVAANIEFGLTDTAVATYDTYCGQDGDTAFVVLADTTKYLNLNCTAGSPNVFTTC